MLARSGGPDAFCPGDHARPAGGRSRFRRSLHRDRDDEAQAPRRSRGVARRQVGGLPGDRGRASVGGAQHRRVPRVRRGRRAAAADQPPEGRHEAPLQPRRQASGLPLEPRRQLPGVSPGVGGRRSHPCHLPSGRRRCVRLDRRSNSPGHLRREARRKGRREAGKLRPRLHGSLRPPLGHLGGREAQASLRGSPRRERGARPHARRSRRAALQPGGGGRLRRLARREGDLLLPQRRQAPGRLHQRRPVRGSRGGRRAQEDCRQSRLRRSLPLQPRRHDDRLPRADARVTSRTDGGSWSTTARAGPCAT